MVDQAYVHNGEIVKFGRMCDAAEQLVHVDHPPCAYIRPCTQFKSSICRKWLIRQPDDDGTAVDTPLIGHARLVLPDPPGDLPVS